MGYTAPGSAGVPLLGRTPSGYYVSQPGTLSLATVANSRLQVQPFLFSATTVLNQAAIEVTVAGDAGSLIRLGAYADNNGLPGDLIADWGTLVGDNPASLGLTINQVLSAGVYWIGCAVQNAPSVQPTMRLISQSLISVPSSAPYTTVHNSGYGRNGVTGALPANFMSGAFTAAPCPRIQLRAA